MSQTLTPEQHDSYDRSAGFMDLLETWLETVTFINRLRKSAWAAAEGPMVLEIGVGSGRGLALHPPDARVVAFDFSPSMLRRASAKAKRMGSHTDLLLADVNHLPFKDGVFDTALATFVFCMPPDPIAALAEVGRVCLPDGQIVLLEHVRPTNPLLGKAADLLERVSSRGAEHVNRDTAANVRHAGLEMMREERHRMGIVKLMQARLAAVKSAVAEGEVDASVAS
jgi:ubiquinone/menaquinone biosynthesis C-methylase UbiE